MPPIIHCINHEFCGGYASQFPGLCLACALRARKLARQRRGCLGILFRLHEWSIRRKHSTVGSRRPSAATVEWMGEMTFEKFMELVLNMRISQKAYFKDRRQSDLIKARELEKAVDDAVVAWAIAARATPAQPDQPTLFGDEQ